VSELPTKNAASHIGHRVERNPRFDAYYCFDCHVWLEAPCGDPTCEFCAPRPG
jgi:hypothetical protein